MTTEKVLTNEQIARVFAMYMPCATMQGGNNFNRILVGVGGFEDAGFCYGRLKNNASVANQFVSNFQLLLTPLSAISDEDACSVAEISGFRRDSPSLLKFGKEIVTMIIYNATDFHSFWMSFDTHLVIFIYQYLIQKGYAVPLFMEPRHPDNGKTAIELGLAIDKSTIK